MVFLLLWSGRSRGEARGSLKSKGLGGRQVRGSHFVSLIWLPGGWEGGRKDLLWPQATGKEGTLFIRKTER